MDIDGIAAIHIQRIAAGDAASGHDDAFQRLPGQRLDPRPDAEAAVFDRRRQGLRHPPSPLRGVVDDRFLAPGAVHLRDEAGAAVRVHGEHAMLLRLSLPGFLQFAQLFRAFGGEVPAFREVLVQVVQPPDIRIQVAGNRHLPGHDAVMHSGRLPAILVNSPVAPDFVVLQGAFRWGVGVLVGVAHAHPVERLLRHAIHLGRGGNPGRLQDAGGEVDDVVVLAANSRVADAVRPEEHQRHPDAAAIHMVLVVGEGGVAGGSPAGMEMIDGFGAAPVFKEAVVALEAAGHAVERHRLVVQAGHASLGAGAVVGGDDH